MDDPPSPSRKWIRGVRVEITHLPILGIERALIGVTNAHVQCQRWRNLPIILEIEAVDGRTWQSACELAGKDPLPHGPKEETCKRVACVRNIVAVRQQPGGHVVETKITAGTPDILRI